MPTSAACTSCHTLEDALMMLDTYHGTIFMGYPTEQTLSTCVACHIWAAPAAHLHPFDALGQTSCSRTRTARASRATTSTRTATSSAGLREVQPVQGHHRRGGQRRRPHGDLRPETLTSNDDFFYKSIKDYGDFDASDLAHRRRQHGPELYNNWVFSVGGNVENPIEMTLPELVEKFGTVTTVMNSSAPSTARATPPSRRLRSRAFPCRRSSTT